MALKKTKKRSAGMASRVTSKQSQPARLSRRWLWAASSLMLSSLVVGLSYHFWQQPVIE